MAVLFLALFGQSIVTLFVDTRNVQCDKTLELNGYRGVEQPGSSSGS